MKNDRHDTKSTGPGSWPRLALVGLLGLAAMTGRSAAQTAPPAETDRLHKVDVFAGYSYWDAADDDPIQGHSYQSVGPGFIYGGHYFFERPRHFFEKPWKERHLGVDVEGSYHRSQPCANCLYTISGGPVAQFRVDGFVVMPHVLFGAAKLSGPNYPSINGSTFYENQPHWGFVQTDGVSVDHAIPKVTRKLEWRMVQLDLLYIHVNFGAPTTTSGGTASLVTLQVSTGLTYHWDRLGVRSQR